ncbi:cell division protein FtsQ [Desulfuromusa kysingii]|uniref:Cell division protein FtsQ n=1 Tax=Desulfuromusa kysingii TaxID=37625 RepID=A0A1H3ZG09_9BACT|nr:FtsQ-type POTRA domain-containing protein [Desulfuromusa kysingii]SEA22706.1 cell division protein FtsQ [Desulfuromusa kysingii]
MRDLKKNQKQSRKVRQNKLNKQAKPLNWRKLLRRTLRVGTTVFSAVLIIVGGFFVTQLLLTSDLFRIDQIRVQGNQRLSEEQIEALSDIEMGVNTFHLDLQLIGQKIEENPWVKEVQVQRIFPRQVVITLQEREPVAIVNLGYLYYLDSQGEIFKVLGAGDNLDFPIVTGFNQEKAQQHDAEYAQYLRQIVALLDDLKNRQLFSIDQVSEIHHEAGGQLSIYTLAGGVEVKLGYTGHSKKLDRLEKIYAQLQPKLQVLDYIDLNVNEKVIVRIERLKKNGQS